LAELKAIKITNPKRIAELQQAFADHFPEACLFSYRKVSKLNSQTQDQWTPYGPHPLENEHFRTSSGQIETTKLRVLVVSKVPREILKCSCS
jgi:exonuclease I